MVSTNCNQCRKCLTPVKTIAMPRSLAAAALNSDRVAGGSIEIAGDELTGEQIAEAYQHRYDVRARYEPLPIEVLGGDADQRAMFEWFAHLPAFQADFAATRALAPGTKTFEQWLATRPDL